MNIKTKQWKGNVFHAENCWVGTCSGLLMERFHPIQESVMCECFLLCWQLLFKAEKWRIRRLMNDWMCWGVTAAFRSFKPNHKSKRENVFLITAPVSADKPELNRDALLCQPHILTVNIAGVQSSRLVPPFHCPAAAELKLMKTKILEAYFRAAV